MSGKAKLWKCIAPTAWRGMMMLPGDEIHTENPAFPEYWEPVDGVWPEVKQEAKAIGIAVSMHALAEMELHKEWGSDYEKNGMVAFHAVEVVDAEMDGAFSKALRSIGGADHPAIIKGLYILGSLAGVEKPPHSAQQFGHADQPGEADATTAPDATTGTTEAATAAPEATTQPATGRATARAKPGAKA